MPSKIVDLSARSRIIRDEPFHVHFWECTPREYLDLLKSPRKVLAAMGVEIPAGCRIETTIENHGCQVVASSSPSLRRRAASEPRPISAQAIEALRQHRRLQLEQRLKEGSDYRDYDLVFAAEQGTPLLWRIF